MMQLLVLIFPKDSHLDFAKSLTRSAGCLPVKIPLCHGHLTRIQTGILMSGLQRHFHHTQGMPILLPLNQEPARAQQTSRESEPDRVSDSQSNDAFQKHPTPAIAQLCHPFLLLRPERELLPFAGKR